MTELKPVDRITQTQEFTFSYVAGRSLSYFYQKLHDERKIIGSKCPKCGSVLVPPVDFCRECFVETYGNWVEVADKGVVYLYTVIHTVFPFYVQPKPPYAYAQIKLDGADDWFYHYLLEVDPNKVEAGMRVEAVWAHEDTKVAFRVGGLLGEIAYFRPADPAKRI